MPSTPNNNNTTSGTSANTDVLTLLSNCINVGQGNPGGAVSVGIYDSLALSNLSRIIRESFRKEKSSDPNNDNYERLNSINAALGNFGEQNQETHDLLNEFIEEVREQNDKKGIFGKISSFITENLPVIGQVGNALIKGTKFIYDQQMQWIDWQDQLNTAGIMLSDGLGSLTSQYEESAEGIKQTSEGLADAYGVTIENFVSILTNNSQMVAKMGGTFGNAAKSTSTFLGKMRDYNKELIFSKGELTKLSTSFADRYGVLFANQENGMELLAEKTKNYLKYLDALSKATGKHKEQIDAETKQRETDLRWKVWMMDPNNMKKAAAWNAMGLTLQQQQALAFGLPNKEYMQLMLSNPQFLKFAQDIGNSQSDEEMVDALDKLKKWAVDNEDVLKQRLEWARNSGLLNTPEEAFKYLMEGNVKALEAIGLDIDKLKKIINGEFTEEEKNDRDMRLAVIKKEEELAELHNKTAGLFRLSSENMQKIFDAQEKIIESMNNLVSSIDSLIKSEGFQKLINNTIGAATDLVNDTAELFAKDKIGFNDILNFVNSHPVISSMTALSIIPGILIWGFGALIALLGGEGFFNGLWNPRGGRGGIRGFIKNAIRIGGGVYHGSKALDEYNNNNKTNALREGLHGAAYIINPYFGMFYDMLGDKTEKAAELYYNKIEEGTKKILDNISEESRGKIRFHLIKFLDWAFSDNTMKDYYYEDYLKDTYGENSKEYQDYVASKDHSMDWLADYVNDAMEKEKKKEEDQKNLAEKMAIIKNSSENDNSNIENLQNQLLSYSKNTMSEASLSKLNESLSGKGFHEMLEDTTKNNLKDIFYAMDNRLLELKKELEDVNVKLGYNNEKEAEGLCVQYEMKNNAKEHYTQCVFNNMNEYTDKTE